jgi:hypothetical protein
MMANKRVMYWTIKLTSLNIEMKVCNLAHFTRVAKLNYFQVSGKIAQARRKKLAFVQMGEFTIGWTYEDPISTLFKMKNVSFAKGGVIKPYAPPVVKRKYIKSEKWYARFNGRRAYN